MAKDKGKNYPKPFSVLDYEILEEWTPELAKTKLRELYKGVLELADDTIKFYHRYRHKKAGWSKAIRVIAIILLVISTLIPYFASVFGNAVTFLSIGYISAGLGGGLLLLDRFYGISNSWMRFVLTGMDLEGIRNIFVENWQIIYLNNIPLTKESFAILVNALIQFQVAFNNVVKAETEVWAKEFQQNLKDLIAALKVQSDELRSGLAEAQTKQAAAAVNRSPVANENVPAEVIKEAIDRRYAEWKAAFNVEAIGTGVKMVGGQRTGINCLLFIAVEKLEVGTEAFTTIPKVIRYESLNGMTYDIPTDVRAGGGKIKPAAQPVLPCNTSMPKRPGCSIGRLNDANSGTLGLIVFRNKTPFLLSCYHVLCGPELERKKVEFTATNAAGSAVITSPSKPDGSPNIRIATVTEGLLNDQLDAAIAEIEDPVNITGMICGSDKTPTTILPITNDHERDGLVVKAVGRTSGSGQGTIQSSAINCDIDYGDGIGKITMRSLVCTDLPFTGGDSGAALLDTNNNVIGIIVAVMGQLTYAIPIQRILSKFSLTLTTTL
jgi:conflict system pore-forming effector with SLATT domain/trypsin-like peptidase